MGFEPVEYKLKLHFHWNSSYLLNSSHYPVLLSFMLLQTHLYEALQNEEVQSIIDH